MWTAGSGELFFRPAIFPIKHLLPGVIIEAKDAGQGWPPLIVAEVWVTLLGRAYGLLGHSCDCRETDVKPS